MERESLLILLVVVLGGTTLHACSPWLAAEGKRTDAQRLERGKWLQLWLPIVPGLLGGAWLCGWALVQPDPVPASTIAGVVALGAPFVLLIVRAGVRAGWSLARPLDDLGAVTVGLLRPRVIVSPLLAERLDARALQAALAHEQAHARHRDPLRIWLAQVVTDLQWPWPQAQKRLRDWLVALELARDAEARAQGAEGTDLAAAVLASLRFSRSAASLPCASLGGEPGALKERIACLLQPLTDGSPERIKSLAFSIWFLPPLLLLATLLGTLFGNILINPLLGIAS